MKNNDFTLVCSNCAGGFLYHWLGVKFESPFINLYLNNEDFLTAMENFDEFINGEIVEDHDDIYDYPIGVGIHGEKIHFMHYSSFKEAISKWNVRKKRINKSNMAVMLTNLGCGISNDETSEKAIIKRFNKLPFKNKLIFSGKNYKMDNVIYLKGYSKVSDSKNIWATKNIFGLRYIDQFDYVKFFNTLQN